MTPRGLGPLLAVTAVASRARLQRAQAEAKTRAAPRHFSQDWRDGRIDGTYSVSCYQAALAQLPEDLRIYSSAESDIKRALLARSQVTLAAPAKSSKAGPIGRRRQRRIATPGVGDRRRDPRGGGLRLRARARSAGKRSDNVPAHGRRRHDGQDRLACPAARVRLPVLRDLRRPRLDLRLRPLRRPDEEQHPGSAGSRRWCRTATTSSRSTRRSSSTRRSGRHRATSAASPTRSSTAAPASCASAPTSWRTRNCGRKPSKRPGETPECDLTEPRQFNLMFETHRRRACRRRARVRTCAPRPRRASSSTSRTCSRSRGASRRSASPRSASRSATRSRPATSSSACASSSRWRWSSSSRRASGEKWYRYWIEERLNWYTCATGCARARLRVREHGPEERSHYSQGTSDIEYEYPIGWGELEGIANRGDFDLTQHAEHSRTKLEYVGQDGERYVPYVIEPAVSIERIIGRAARRRLRRGGRRRARANRASPPSEDGARSRRPSCR